MWNTSFQCPNEAFFNTQKYMEVCTGNKPSCIMRTVPGVTLRAGTAVTFTGKPNCISFVGARIANFYIGLTALIHFLCSGVLASPIVKSKNISSRLGCLAAKKSYLFGCGFCSPLARCLCRESGAEPCHD